MLKPKEVIDLATTTISEGGEDKVSRLAAALAYFTAFSLAPILLIVIAIVSLFIQRQAAEAAVITQVQGLLGRDGAELVRTMLENTGPKGGNILVIIIGVITLLIGATGVFGQLQGALNKVWNVPDPPKQGLIGTLRGRLFSFAMILVIGFLLLVSLVLSAGLAAAGKFLTAGWSQDAVLVQQVLNVAVSFVVITLLFAMLFKFVPDIKIAWRDVWIGAAITSVLFIVGQQIIGVYLGKSSMASTYGAAASLAILLVWVYYTAQIMLYGAEFTQVYARTYGSHVGKEAEAGAKAEKVGPGEGSVQERRQREPLGAAALVPKTSAGKRSDGTVQRQAQAQESEGLAALLVRTALKMTALSMVLRFIDQRKQ